MHEKNVKNRMNLCFVQGEKSLDDARVILIIFKFHIWHYSQMSIEAYLIFHDHAHYSKSQIFVQKCDFDKTPTTNIFLTIFLVKSKLSTAKKSKTTTFSRVFHPKKIDNFLGKSKVEFLDKE